MAADDFSAISYSNSSTKIAEHSMRIDHLVDQTAELQLLHRELDQIETDQETFPTERDCSDDNANRISDSSSTISDGDEPTTRSPEVFLPRWSRRDRRGKRSNTGQEDEDNNANALNLNLHLSSDHTVSVPLKKQKIEHTNSDSKRYECLTCNRSFSSFQALGGHRASHSKVKVDSKSKDDKEQREHKCKICNKTFPSGQALGGHQKRHWWARPTTVAKTCGSNKICLFDLNELPSLENEEDAISFLS